MSNTPRILRLCSPETRWSARSLCSNWCQIRQHKTWDLGDFTGGEQTTPGQTIYLKLQAQLSSLTKVPNLCECRILFRFSFFPEWWSASKCLKQISIRSKSRQNWKGMNSIPLIPKPNLDLKFWCWCFPKISMIAILMPHLGLTKRKNKHKQTNFWRGTSSFLGRSV